MIEQNINFPLEFQIATDESNKNSQSFVPITQANALGFLVKKELCFVCGEPAKIISKNYIRCKACFREFHLSCESCGEKGICKFCKLEIESQCTFCEKKISENDLGLECGICSSKIHLQCGKERVKDVLKTQYYENYLGKVISHRLSKENIQTKLEIINGMYAIHDIGMNNNNCNQFITNFCKEGLLYHTCQNCRVIMEKTKREKREESVEDFKDIFLGPSYDLHIDKEEFDEDSENKVKKIKKIIKKIRIGLNIKVKEYYIVKWEKGEYSMELVKYLENNPYYFSQLSSIYAENSPEEMVREISSLSFCSISQEIAPDITNYNTLIFGDFEKVNEMRNIVFFPYFCHCILLNKKLLICLEDDNQVKIWKKRFNHHPLKRKIRFITSKNIVMKMFLEVLNPKENIRKIVDFQDYTFLNNITENNFEINFDVIVTTTEVYEKFDIFDKCKWNSILLSLTNEKVFQKILAKAFSNKYLPALVYLFSTVYIEKYSDILQGIYSYFYSSTKEIIEHSEGLPYSIISDEKKFYSYSYEKMQKIFPKQFGWSISNLNVENIDISSFVEKMKKTLVTTRIPLEEKRLRINKIFLINLMLSETEKDKEEAVKRDHALIEKEEIDKVFYDLYSLTKLPDSIVCQNFFEAMKEVLNQEKAQMMKYLLLSLPINEHKVFLFSTKTRNLNNDYQRRFDSVENNICIDITRLNIIEELIKKNPHIKKHIFLLNFPLDEFVSFYKMIQNYSDIFIYHFFLEGTIEESLVSFSYSKLESLLKDNLSLTDERILSTEQKRKMILNIDNRKHLKGLIRERLKSKENSPDGMIYINSKSYFVLPFTDVFAPKIPLKPFELPIETPQDIEMDIERSSISSEDLVIPLEVEMDENEADRKITLFKSNFNIKLKNNPLSAKESLEMFLLQLGFRPNIRAIMLNAIQNNPIPSSKMDDFHTLLQREIKEKALVNIKKEYIEFYTDFFFAFLLSDIQSEFLFSDSKIKEIKLNLNFK